MKKIIALALLVVLASWPSMAFAFETGNQGQRFSGDIAGWMLATVLEELRADEFGTVKVVVPEGLTRTVQVWSDEDYVSIRTEGSGILHFTDVPPGVIRVAISEIDPTRSWGGLSPQALEPDGFVEFRLLTRVPVRTIRIEVAPPPVPIRYESPRQVTYPAPVLPRVTTTPLAPWDSQQNTEQQQTQEIEPAWEQLPPASDN